jgi:hypothetical protein
VIRWGESKCLAAGPRYDRAPLTRESGARADENSETPPTAGKPVRAKGLRTIVDVMETSRPPRRNRGGRPRKVAVPDVAPEDLDPVLVLKMIAGSSSVPPAVRAAACRTLLMASRTDGEDAAEPEAISAKVLNARTMQILRRAN